jgi:hypothetical protein
VPHSIACLCSSTSHTFPWWVNWVHNLGFENDCCTGIIILPPFCKTRTSFTATLCTTTKAHTYQIETSGDHSYVVQKWKVWIYCGLSDLPVFFKNINFSMSSTLWLAIFKSSSEFVKLLSCIYKRSSLNLMVLSTIPQHSYSKDKGGITSLLVQLLTNVTCDWMRILFPYALHIEFRCNFLVPISLISVGSCF